MEGKFGVFGAKQAISCRFTSFTDIWSVPNAAMTRSKNPFDVETGDDGEIEDDFKETQDDPVVKINGAKPDSDSVDSDAPMETGDGDDANADN